MNLLLLSYRAPVAEAISSIIRAGGHDVTCVSDPGSLREALRREAYAAIVTETPLVGMARAHANLPAINMDAFIYGLSDPMRETGAARARFDAEAFLGRLRYVERHQFK